MSLSAARAEYESFQIVVTAPVGGLTNVTVTAPALVSSGGDVIPPANLTLFREHYVYLSEGSPDWGGNRNKPAGPGWYPDALIPFVNPATGNTVPAAVPFNLPADTNAPIWIDVFVPRNQLPGLYQGEFTVTSDQGSASVSLALTVWSFELPLKPALKSCFGTTDDYLNRGEELLRNRLMPRHVDPQDERRLIDQYGLNCINSGFWSGASLGVCTMAPPPLVQDFQREAATHQPDLFLYDYSADEIGHCTGLYDTIKGWARNMHQAGLSNLITMEPIPELYDDGSGTGRSAVDIWVVLPKMYDEALGQIEYVQAKGDQVWSYNCLDQDDYSPKWLLDFAPLNFRLQPGFLSQSLGLTGLLYWSVDHWGADPWADPTGAYGLPGEGVLLYPGEPVGLPGVVPSLRLKWLRDGVDDYDYLALLRGWGYGDWADEIARRVAPDWSHWTRDPKAVEAVRLEVGEMLTGALGLMDFIDVPPFFWAYQQIHAAYLASIVQGYGDSTYRPNDPVTRDQIAVYISRGLAGGDANVPTGPAQPTFVDIPPDHWAYKYVEYAHSRNIIFGYSTGSYQPDDKVDRGQMAVFIARSIVNPTGDAGLASYQPPLQPTYTDVERMYWGYRYVEYLTKQGIVGGYGDGTYRPTATLTRDQLAVFIARAFKLP